MQGGRRNASRFAAALGSGGQRSNAHLMDAGTCQNLVAPAEPLQHLFIHFDAIQLVEMVHAKGNPLPRPGKRQHPRGIAVTPQRGVEGNEAVAEQAVAVSRS
jgi:hypothetical protein